MNMTNTYKKNSKLFYIVFLLAILSVINTVEGFVYCKNGIDSIFFILEGVSIVISLLLLHSIWCLFDDGKCSTIKKH